jgi:glycosyltransferase involved in cell wall biosynthesis
MNIAFHAPMKPPTFPRPSGDRTIARLLMRALEVGGADVRIASETRTWSGVADPDRLLKLRTAGELERKRLIALYGSPTATFRPDIWFTYHNHYKAPDFLGPAVSRELGIPYVIAEASYAASRAEGPWADWLRHTRAGIEAARLIFSFTKRDEEGLRAIVPSCRLRRLAPFIEDVATEPPRDRGGPGDPVRLVTVAMMRRGAKEKSYRLLADALGRLSHRNWELEVVGDGEAFGELQELLGGMPGDRVALHGKLEGPPLARVLARGDVFVWPGIEEAFGMAYLEAQAHGLAVAACDTAGVGEVVRDGETGLLAHAVTPSAFAAAVDQLIASEELRRDLGDRARRHVLERHSVEVAARVLQVELAGLGVRG